jgi:iron complex outermembrane receptor protein
MVFLSMVAAGAAAQETSTITGKVTLPDGRASDAILISIEGTTRVGLVDRDGGYRLHGVPTGTRIVVFSGLGYRSETRVVEIRAGEITTLDITLDREPIRLAELTVVGASRMPERIAEAPAAIAVVDRAVTAGLAPTGQVPLALAAIPGVDVVQSGVDEFNVNARGFNSSLNRRMLVLMDGRDLAVPLLGFQEWRGIGRSMADLWSIEVVRGPGSALYGANAYSGVINIRTPPARDVVGSRLSLGGGELRSAWADLRHAGLIDEGRLGYKLNAGYSTSDSWTRSRTSADKADLRREYGDLGDGGIPDVMEAVPLFGQTLDPATRTATGRPDPVKTTYGSLRVDYYGTASLTTVEGGAALLENTMLVSGIGRIQADRVLRPWARLALASDAFSVSAWYSGRNTMDDPHVSLGSGASLVDKSAMMQAEGQANRVFLDERAQLVVGASVRNSRTKTDGTLFDPADDNRSDVYGSVYGQMSFDLSHAVTAVGALRYDAGALFDAQLSPRLALVFTPSARHSLRLTVHRAFQTPTQLEHFLRVPAAAPANFGPLEAGLRASPLGPALAGVPQGELFTNSAAVPVLGLGNNDLDVESVRSIEAGYRGQFGGVYLSIEAFHARLSNFVTDLLPGANPAYPLWTAPAEVPETVRSTLEQTVRNQLAAAGQRLAAAGLTRLPDGRTAIVVSYANAGRATEQGIEIGTRIPIGRRLALDGSYTFLDVSIDAASLLVGDVLEVNTPRHKGSLGASYRSGPIDAGATLRLVDRYDWAAGVFAGPVPARQLVDMRAAVHIGRNLVLQAVATNVFDQRQYEIFGGSLVGRRVLVGMTTAW